MVLRKIGEWNEAKGALFREMVVRNASDMPLEMSGYTKLGCNGKSGINKVLRNKIRFWVINEMLCLSGS